MATTKEITVNGVVTEVTEFDHSAQEIDDATARALAGGAIDQLLAGKEPAIESTDYPGCYYRMEDGTQEWINPPMAFGVEYRTTERYDGNPVYVKTINFGALPNASSKNVSIGSSGIETMISTIGNMKRPSFDESYTLPYLNPDNFVGLVANNGSVTVYSTSDWSNWTATVTVKYTKTTD